VTMGGVNPEDNAIDTEFYFDRPYYLEGGGGPEQKNPGWPTGGILRENPRKGIYLSTQKTNGPAALWLPHGSPMFQGAGKCRTTPY